MWPKCREIQSFKPLVCKSQVRVIASGFFYLVIIYRDLFCLSIFFMWTSCQNTSDFSILFRICCTWWRSMFEKLQFSFLQFFHSCVINHENEHTVLNKTTKSLDRLLARVYHRSIGKGKKKPNWWQRPRWCQRFSWYMYLSRLRLIWKLWSQIT